MSFGAGHMQDMNNRMKQFQANRPSSRAKFKEGNRENIYSEEAIQAKKINWHEVSAEQLELVRQQIKLKAEAENFRRRKILWISVGITLLLISVFFYLYG